MIFFDIDGTLLDHKKAEYLGVIEFKKNYKNYFVMTNEKFYELWVKISEKNFTQYLKGNLSFKEQQNQRIIDLFKTINLNINSKKASKIFKIYLKIYQKNWIYYSDVKNCLDELKKDYPLGIISNGDHEQQIKKLEKLDIRNYFDIIITAGKFKVSKPNIKIFEIACKKANLTPDKCFYIGDNLETDIFPCKNIQMNAIWLNRNKKETNYKNIIMIDNLSKVKNYIIKFQKKINL